MRSLSLIGHQLCQNTAGRLRMNERDLQSEEASAGCLVDQPGALRGEPCQLCGEIVDLEGDVVHPRPAAGEEPPDRRVGAERVQELDAAPAHVQRGRLDPLVGEYLAVLDARAE